MKITYLLLLYFFAHFLLLSCSPVTTRNADGPYQDDPYQYEKAIALLQPSYKGTVSVEEAIANRTSRRQFSEQPINTRELSQILWAAYGVDIDGTTGATQTVPSAAGIYPLKIFIITAELEENMNLPPNIYHFDPLNHQLIPVLKGEQRDAMAQVTRYDFIKQAPVIIVLAADYEPMTRFGERGKRYVHMEIGSATQNILLQSEALGLGSVPVGEFEDDKLKAFLETEFEPLMIIPIGNI